MTTPRNRNRFGEPSLQQPGSDWSWRGEGMPKSKPLVTREMALDLVRGVRSGGPLPWLVFSAGERETYRYAQVSSEHGALQVEVSAPFGWASVVTDGAGSQTPAVLTAARALDVVFRWLTAKQLPFGYGLAEVRGAQNGDPPAARESLADQLRMADGDDVDFEPGQAEFAADRQQRALESLAEMVLSGLLDPEVRAQARGEAKQLWLDEAVAHAKRAAADPADQEEVASLLRDLNGSGDEGSDD